MRAPLVPVVLALAAVPAAAQAPLARTICSPPSASPSARRAGMMRSRLGTLAACLAVALAPACKSGDGGAGPGEETQDTVFIVDASLCGAALLPIWFAYQDGPGGAWTRITGSANQYSFTLTGEKFGYAWVAENGPGDIRGPFVRYRTVAESPNPLVLCGGNKTINAVVAGLSGGRGYVAIGGGFGSSTADPGAFAIQSVRPGVQDMLATLSGGANAGRMVLRRDINLAGGATLDTVNFGSTEAFPADTAQLTVFNDFGDALTWSMFYRGADCAGLFVPQTTINSQIRGVPAARQRAGDFHVLTVTATMNADVFRWVTTSFQALAARTVVMGPDAPSVTVSTRPGPYLRLRFEGDLPPELSTSVFATYGNASVLATLLYLDSVATYLEMPDLSGVTGWQPSWGPAPSSTGTWQVQASGVSGDVCEEGATVVGASIRGAY